MIYYQSVSVFLLPKNYIIVADCTRCVFKPQTLYTISPIEGGPGWFQRSWCINQNHTLYTKILTLQKRSDTFNKSQVRGRKSCKTGLSGLQTSTPCNPTGDQYPRLPYPVRIGG